MSTNPVLRLIQRHYSGNELKRTPAQIERERTFFFGVPFNRWSLFPAAVLIQFCCGSLYAWSVFNRPIHIAIYNDPNANKAPNTFYIAVGCFGLSAAIMGPWLERNGPRLGVIVGATLFFLGNLITALALHLKLMWLVYVGYGVVAGFGLGLTYISPVSALQKWFPDHRGMASGFAVCGFGAGSIAIAKVPVPLIDAVGLPLCFVVLGCAYYVCMMASAYVLRIPPPDYSVNGLTPDRDTASPTGTAGVVLSPGKDTEETFHHTSHSTSSRDHSPQPSTAIDLGNTPASAPSRIKMTLIASLTNREYYILYVVFFANSIFGLAAISRLADMISDLFGKDKNVAATIVSVNGGFNLLGRLFFATISDRFGRKVCYIVMLSLQVIGLILLPILTSSRAYVPFLIVVWIMTACYGGGFGVIPAFLTDMFGSKNIGACHGVILTAWSIAGVGGGLLFTGIYDYLVKTKGYKVTDAYIYDVNFYWILSLCAVGWFTMFFSRTTVRDRLFPAAPGELTRIRVFGRLLRIHKPFRFELLSKAEEDRIWREHWASMPEKGSEMAEKE